MRIAEAARLFGYRTLWRTVGLHTAGEGLLRALGSEDEDLRTLAGMFLVQGGERSVPLLQRALESRENLALVLSILGDIGDPEIAPQLERFSQDPDIEVARAARDALEVVKLREERSRSRKPPAPKSRPTGRD